MHDAEATTNHTDSRENGAWTVDDDLAVFRRVKKILEGVPDHAWNRVAAYLAHMLRERAGTVPYRVGAVPESPR